TYMNFDFLSCTINGTPEGVQDNRTLYQRLEVITVHHSRKRGISVFLLDYLYPPSHMRWGFIFLTRFGAIVAYFVLKTRLPALYNKLGWVIEGLKK
ncbi:MAG: hypothetical protein AAEF23_07310, partial [Gammaproteobacteria bacterium]